jgi:hypothetical protein
MPETQGRQESELGVEEVEAVGDESGIVPKDATRGGEDEMEDRVAQG